MSGMYIKGQTGASRVFQIFVRISFFYQKQKSHFIEFVKVDVSKFMKVDVLQLSKLEILKFLNRTIFDFEIGRFFNH